MSTGAPVLCWDIDGTLLSTARAGVYALEHAASVFSGRVVDLQTLTTAGLTDVQIAQTVLADLGVPGAPEAVQRFLQLYAEALPECLTRRQGRVMPQVREILEAIRLLPGWRSILLTGNIRGGAEAKLRHYGLMEFFSDGAFADGTDSRAEIARRAVALVGSASPAVVAARFVVIGDTPHDVTCARAIGAHCIAVATGSHPVEELRATGADQVIRELPPPRLFLELVGSLFSAGRPLHG